MDDAMMEPRGGPKHWQLLERREAVK
jgi:hypothetical protein